MPEAFRPYLFKSQLACLVPQACNGCMVETLHPESRSYAAHSYSAPALCSPRSEGRRNSCEAENCTHSEHAPLQGCREDILGVLCSSWPTQNMPTCQSHATNMPRFMPMFVQVKTTTNLKRQIEGTRERKHIFALRGMQLGQRQLAVGKEGGGRLRMLMRLVCSQVSKARKRFHVA